MALEAKARPFDHWKSLARSGDGCAVQVCRSALEKHSHSLMT
jgi:hypothetical protein